MRLQKFLANAGIASRRASEELIVAGRVRVNGVVVRELGTRVVADADRIEVDGKLVEPSRREWIVLHKPRGYLTTRLDTHARRTVYDLLPEQLHGLFYIGRLDRDSEGVLLFTNDGDVAHLMLHPSAEIEREYDVVVAGELDDTKFFRLKRGVELDDGLAKPKRIRRVGVTTDNKTRIMLTLTEGRKREVRRMMEAVGHGVVRLVRTRYGPVALADLPPGKWRRLTREELAALPEAKGSSGE